MRRRVTVSEAGGQLDALLDEAQAHEVVIERDGAAVGVLVSAEVWERVLDRIEDLEDALAVIRTREEDSVPFIPNA